jgi:hypothetical protein
VISRSELLRQADVVGLQRPRDLIDVVTVHRNGDIPVVASALREVLVSKCEFKAIPVESFWSALPVRDGDKVLASH